MDLKSIYTKDTLPQKYRTNVGDHSYGTPKIIDFNEGTTVRIGKYCSIAEGVVIMLGGNHRLEWITTYPFPALSERWGKARGIIGHPQSRGDVIIGNDVWLGAEAMILSGVSIGDGAAVAARSVVVKDVPPYSVVGGNPAKLLKMRFSDEEIEKLLKIRWWDWPDEKVSRNVAILCDSNIDALLNPEAVPADVNESGVGSHTRTGGWFRKLLSMLRV
jgi:acetyltransferase-like isoleucine patch superfamily enzyme